MVFWANVTFRRTECIGSIMRCIKNSRHMVIPMAFNKTTGMIREEKYINI